MTFGKGRYEVSKDGKSVRYENGQLFYKAGQFWNFGCVIPNNIIDIGDEWRTWWLDMQRRDDESGQYGQEATNADAQATKTEN